MHEFKRSIFVFCFVCSLFSQRGYGSPFKGILYLAQQGDVKAQNNIGSMYYSGEAPPLLHTPIC